MAGWGWLIARRNLSEVQKSYLWGKRYETEKKEPHRPEGDHNDHLKTADKLAEQSGLSAPTIRRAAQFAIAVDLLAENIGPEAKQAIRTCGNGIVQTVDSPTAICDTARGGRIWLTTRAVNPTLDSVMFHQAESPVIRPHPRATIRRRAGSKACGAVQSCFTAGSRAFGLLGSVPHASPLFCSARLPRPLVTRYPDDRPSRGIGASPSYPARGTIPPRAGRSVRGSAAGRLPGKAYRRCIHGGFQVVNHKLNFLTTTVIMPPLATIGVVPLVGTSGGTSGRVLWKICRP